MKTALMEPYTTRNDTFHSWLYQGKLPKVILCLPSVQFLPAHPVGQLQL